MVKAAAARKKIAQAHNSLAVDMESAAIARACSRHRDLQILIVKTISDFADTDKSKIDTMGGGLFREWSLQNLFDLIITFLVEDSITNRRTLNKGESPQKIKYRGNHKFNVAEDKLDNIYNFIELKYIDKKYNLLDACVERNIAAIELLFKSLLSRRNSYGVPAEFNDLIQFVGNKLLKAPGGLLGHIYGYSGTGKTSFCIAVWRWLRREIARKKQLQFIPLYISLSAYDRIGVEQALIESRPFDDVVREKLQPDLDFLIEGIKAWGGEAPTPILIIDGFEPSNLLRQTITRELLSKIDVKNSKIFVSIDLTFYMATDSGRDGDFFQEVDLDSPNFSLELRSVHTYSSRFPQLASAFCSIIGTEDINLEQVIINRARELDFSYVDPFIIFMVMEDIKSNKERQGHYSGLIEQYFRSHINQEVFKGSSSPRTLSVPDIETAAGKIAYWLLTRSHELDLSLILAQGSGGPELAKSVEHLFPNGLSNYSLCVRALLIAYSTLASYSIIRNVFAAKHVVAAYEETPKELSERQHYLRNFNFLYPNYINKCFRHLTRTPAKAKRVLDGAFLIALDPNLSPLLRAHAVYLIGRLSIKANSKDFALRALKEVHEMEIATYSRDANVDRGTEEDLLARERRLLRRGTYISRAYCGDFTAAADYVKQLLDDPKEDSLNRGFHIEYFGDMTYQPEIGFSLRDTPDLPFKNTFYELRRRICEGIHAGVDGISSALWSIEVCTLTSIIRVRHAHGLLTGAFRNEFIEILDKIISVFQIYSGLIFLREYCCMVRRNLACQQFHQINVLRSLYPLKSEVRLGWIERAEKGHLKKEMRFESVADHSLFCHLIAMLLLPPWNETLGDKYDKGKIAQILLYHDLAEAYTGDHTPHQLQHVDDELNWFKYLKMVGTYEGVFGVNDIFDLYSQFHTQSTQEARIARDIDIIENLCQLYVYGCDMNRDEFLSFESTLLSKISTEPGRLVLAKVKNWRNAEPTPGEFLDYKFFA